MTARQIIIKCLDENTDVTCRKHQCDKPENEGNMGKYCHKCSLEILMEYERKIYNKTIDEFEEQLSLKISESIICGILFDNRDNSSYDTSDKIVDYVIDTVKKIADEMRGTK